MNEYNLKVLKDNKVINEKAYNYSIKVLKLIENKKFDSEKIDAFITHLAMAITRIMNDVIAECNYASMVQNIQETLDKQTYQNVKNFYYKIRDFSPIPIPKSEKAFLLLHISNLYKNE